MADNLERVGVEWVVEGVGRFVAEAQRAEKAYDSAVGKFAQGGGRAASATGAMASAAGAAGGPMAALAVFVGNAAVKIGETLVQAIGKAISSTANLAKSALMLGGQFREMEFAAIAVGREMGVTADETRAAIVEINQAGIRYDIAARSVAQLTRNQVDLADATELASIAQATGRLIQEDSSETMDRLILAISTGNTARLTALGITVDKDQAEERYAATLGKSVDALTQQELVQARVNAIIEASGPIMGIYDATMLSASKQLQSLSGRIFPEFLAALGAPFQSAFFTVVKSVSNFVVSLKEAVSEGGALYPVMVRLGAVASLVADGFKSGIDRVIGFVNGFRTDFLGGLASTAEGALRWGVNIAAQLASGLIQGAAAALTAAMNFISNLLGSWLAPGSPPKVASDIDKWGAATMTEYLKGFTEADFGVLNKLQGVLKKVLTSGAYADISRDLIAAIGAGQFDESIYNKIAQAAGKYGDEIAKLAKAQWELAQAEKEVEATEKALEEAREALESSQAQVKGLTKEYNDLLRAGASDEVLKAKLAEINAAEEQRDTAVQAAKEAEEADKAAKKRRDELAQQARVQELLVDELLEMQEAEEASADALKDIGKGLKDVAKGLKGMAGAGGLGDLMAMPEPVEMGEKITDAMGEAIETAKGLLQEKFADIFAPLTEAIAEAGPALSQVSDAFGGLMTTLTPVWNFIVNEVVPTISQGWAIIRDTTREAWGTISTAVQDAGAILADAFAKLGIDFGSLGISWETVKDGMVGAIITFAARTAAKIHWVANVIAAFISGVATVISIGIDLWIGFKDKIAEIMDLIKEITDLSLADILGMFTTIFNRLIEVVTERMDRLRRRILDSFAKIVKSLRQTLKDWVDLGKAIVQGIIDGVNEMYEALKAKIRRMADDILKWFKAKFGVECPDPSPVTAEVGRGAVEGFIKGLEEAARAASFNVDASFAPIGQALLATGGIASAAAQPVASQSVSRIAEVSIGPVTIQSQMDEASFQVMVEQAVMRALGR